MQRENLLIRLFITYPSNSDVFANGIMIPVNVLTPWLTQMRVL